MNLYNWQGKLARSIDMLLDNSEVFDTNPYFRFIVIKHIWKYKQLNN